jgi:hypothetical protein
LCSRGKRLRCLPTDLERESLREDLPFILSNSASCPMGPERGQWDTVFKHIKGQQHMKRWKCPPQAVRQHGLSRTPPGPWAAGTHVSLLIALRGTVSGASHCRTGAWSHCSSSETGAAGRWWVAHQAQCWISANKVSRKGYMLLGVRKKVQAWISASESLLVA